MNFTKPTSKLDLFGKYEKNLLEDQNNEPDTENSSMRMLRNGMININIKDSNNKTLQLKGGQWRTAKTSIDYGTSVMTDCSQNYSTIQNDLSRVNPHDI